MVPEEYMGFPHDGGCSRNLGIVAWVPVTIETAYSGSGIMIGEEGIFCRSFEDKEKTRKRGGPISGTARES